MHVYVPSGLCDHYTVRYLQSINFINTVSKPLFSYCLVITDHLAYVHKLINVARMWDFSYTAIILLMSYGNVYLTV